jgi:hypothetical protein
MGQAQDDNEQEQPLDRSRLRTIQEAIWKAQMALWDAEDAEFDQLIRRTIVAPLAAVAAAPGPVAGWPEAARKQAAKSARHLGLVIGPAKPADAIAAQREAAIAQLHQLSAPAAEQGRLLSPQQLLDLLRDEFNYRIGTRHLQKLRTDQTGPPYRRIGNQVVYPASLARDWLRHRMSAVVHSTTEETALRSRMRERSPPKH